MGWYYSNKTKGSSIKSFFEKEFGSIVECKVVNLREAYLAVENTKTKEVYGLVCLIDYRKNDYCNFGYKPMDESMHPYYYNCPESVLKHLSPTTDTNSLTWRNKCKENSSKVKLVEGLVVTFENEISFGRYGKATKFTCIDAKKLHFYAHGLGINVKLRKNTFTNYKNSLDNK